MKQISILILLTIFLSINLKAQKFEELAKTPPMGWNSWNKFGCNVSEDLIIETTDAIVNSGLMDAGYEYIVIDDCWQVGRDEKGNIIVDEKRFPHGIKYLADYVHSKGLKFGIYSCAGTKTCMGRPGGRGYEFQDARTYAKWGVDYLKYDWCYTSNQDPQASYKLMRDALYAAGRPVVFSICEWGQSKPWEWAKDVGHLWRTSGDIFKGWSALLSNFDQQRGLAKYAGPGHWNDPDMLQIGNGGMNLEEYKTHFSLWCMLAAPLMAGNDIRNMDEDILKILTNDELIAVDQDVLGKQAECFRNIAGYEIWVKKLAGKEKAVCLFNRSDETKTVEINIHELLNALEITWFGKPLQVEDYQMKDLWEHKNIDIEKERINVTLTPHSAKVYRFVKK